MLRTGLRQGLLLDSARKLVPALAIAGATAMLAPENARSQSFNVAKFECGAGDTVSVDVRGLGNQNVCIVAEAALDLFCVCQTNSGNCPNTENKRTVGLTVSSSQALEPKNGRVRTTAVLENVPAAGDDDLWDTLSCPRGQDTTLIGFDTQNADGATFTLCTTAAQPGQDCECFESTTLATEECGVTGAGEAFPGTDEDCEALFPQLN